MSPTVPPPSSSPLPRTFPVEFTPPGSWLPSPDKYWRLIGAGELLASPDTIVLRGLRGRLSAAPIVHSISRADIANVIQEGRLVQCHVRTSSGTKVLRVWTADPVVAAELAALLPTERTPEFTQSLAEQQAFEESLRRINARAVVTPVLVGLNCLVFVSMLFAGAGLVAPDPAIMVEWGSNFGPQTLGGEWWRLLTSTFLHWGVIHLAFNMWALWSIGLLTERLFGSIHFLVLYLFAGLCGGIASLLWHPTVNSAGASGAIFGVMGALAVFIFKPETRIAPGIARPIARNALIFIGYNLLNGLTHAGIDNSAHVGGLLGGAAMGWFLARPLDPDHRQRSAGRLVLICLGGAIALIAVSWPLTHQARSKVAEWQFRRDLATYSRMESDIIQAQHALDTQLADKKITQAEWGKRMLRDVLPQWQAAEEQLASGHLAADSIPGRLQAQVIEFLDEKRAGLRLAAEGARDNDPAKMAQGDAILTRNDARAKDLVEHLHALY